MVTLLTSLPAARTIFGVAAGDSSQDPLLNLLVTEASAIVGDWCERDFGMQQYTRMVAGNNGYELILQDLPVVGTIVTGNTTVGSAVVTNVGSTLNLFDYQSVVCGAFPSGTSIAQGGVGTNTLTLSQPATLTATTINLACGIALWQDDNAYGGTNPNAFAPGTLLQEGVDYYPDWKGGPGTTCDSGVIYRIGTYWFRPGIYLWGLVTPQNGPPTLSVKARYNAGYAQVPSAVQAACELLLAGMRLNGVYGRSLQQLANGKLSLQLSASEKLGLLTPEVTTLLARYKITTISPR